MSASKLYFPVGALPEITGPYYALAAGSAGGDTLLERDDEHETYRAAKRVVMQRQQRAPVRLEDTTSAQAIEQTEALIRSELGDITSRGLDLLVAELQEDLVIMQRPSAAAPERARAIYLNVCFPSGWNPTQLRGKNFLSLHAKVPYEGNFDRSQRANQAEPLFTEPSVRFVWSLSPDSQLDHHPETPRPNTWQTTDEAFLRVERQVIKPLSLTTSVFLIRTYIYPLTRLDVTQRWALTHAVMEMSETMRRYKGVLGYERRVAELLGD